MNNYAMKIGLASKEENPTMRAWVVYYLGNGSSANGCYGRLDITARLVGLRTEGASKKENLDEKIIN